MEAGNSGDSGDTVFAVGRVLQQPLRKEGGRIHSESNVKSTYISKVNLEGIAEEVLYSIKTVKILNGEEFEADTYRRQIAKATEKAIDYGYIRGSMASLFFYSIIMTYTIGFWYGSVLVGNR